MSALWGPMGWITLHSISVIYPDMPSQADKEILSDFLQSFGDCITCPSCQKHFVDMLKTYKIVHPEWNNTKRDLFLAICRMHNSVNRRLDKPILKSVAECISAMQNACRNTTPKQFREKYISYVIKNWTQYNDGNGFMNVGIAKRMDKINSQYWNPRDVSFESVTFEEGDVLENVQAIGDPFKLSTGFPTITSGVPLPSVGLRMRGGRFSLFG